MIGFSFYFCKVPLILSSLFAIWMEKVREFWHSLWDAVKIKGRGVHDGKVYPIIRWLCGAWALGIGLRLGLEITAGYFNGVDYIHVPIYPPIIWINLFFDFVPLLIFGTIVTVIETIEFCIKICEKGGEWHPMKKWGSNFSEKLMKPLTPYFSIHGVKKLRKK